MPRKRKKSSRSSSKARPRTRRPPSRRARGEAVRRAPLEPALPLDADASPGGLDGNVLDVLADTQTLASEQPGPNALDRQRGTILTGGDVDAAWDEADVGEEAVGGSTPTPDQDVVDDLGRAVGVTYSDTEPLRPEEKEKQRDEKRWELDPASSPDYPERKRALDERPRDRATGRSRGRDKTRG